MRKTLLLLTTIALALLLAGGVALAATKQCKVGVSCNGTSSADTITGTIAVDEIYALGGDDSVQALGGADFLKGGSGKDTLDGGDGNDKSGGGTGNDIFYGGAGNDRVSGGEGEDEIHGGPGDDIDLDGDHLIDKIYGEDGNDLELDGDRGNDEIHGGPGDDGGAPTSDNLRNRGLRGEGGENWVYGEDGADTIDAQTTVDLAGALEHIFGGNDNDTITAADGLVDVIDCGLGLDTVVSYDTGLDQLVKVGDVDTCENATPTPTSQPLP
jgi:Ca2+-binding RTX toxin-like protein